MTRFVFSPRYGVDLGGHVFPTQKYGRVAARLRQEDGIPPSNFVEPECASASTITAVHTQRYYAACESGALSAAEIAQLELPWSAALFDAAARAVRGTCMATDLAMAHGAGLHIGGGFHHAFPDHGEGFCVFNDVACAIRRGLVRNLFERPLVVDCDLHHGNGTASIFGTDPRVATFSIHEGGIYPFIKPPSTVDIDLRAGTEDSSYLSHLRDALEPLIDEHRPDVLYYVAGADPFAEDQLGSLRLSKRGLRERDRLVVGYARSASIPFVVTLAGGYARDPEDTADIHLATFREASSLWRGAPP
ncbi:MAG: histone deacetylase [Acidobacteria bacterium]|nr:histone deacetylase [Acidobacteriota bacterium]